MEPCRTCGRLPLRDDPGLVAELAQRIRYEGRDRLHRTEMELNAATMEERLQLTGFLGSMLQRRPLAGATSGPYRFIRGIIDALWFDVADRATDPLDPNAPHPDLAESHPWKAPDEG